MDRPVTGTLDGSAVDLAAAGLPRAHVEEMVARADAAAPTMIIVQVLDEARRRVRDADVLVDGVHVGTTDLAGLAVVDVPQRPAWLAARALVHEEPSTRDVAGVPGREAPWSWRVYLTTMLLTRGPSNVRWLNDQVEDGTRFVVTTVKRQRVLIGLHLVVSIEWAATAAEMSYLKDRVLECSELLFNATNGQMCIERVAVYNARRHWDEAHVRVHASRTQPSNSTLGRYATTGHINMNPYDMWQPTVLLHELGHLALGLHDEYEAPGGGPAFCTAASVVRSPGTPFTEDGIRQTCIMGGSRNPWQKICSSNPANPHLTNTEQGETPCWDAWVARFAPPDGLPPADRWWLQRPNRELCDLLPDAGPPLSVTTTGFGSPGGRLARSFVPAAALKPVWRLSRRRREGTCDAPVRVRVNSGGRLIGGARVLLHSDGLRLDQGLTRAQTKTYQDGSVEGPGELLIRGGHVGDTVTAAVADGGRLRVGTATITGCGVVDVAVRPVSVFGARDDRSALPVATTEPVRRTVQRSTRLVGDHVPPFQLTRSVTTVAVPPGATRRMRADGAPFLVRATVDGGAEPVELTMHADVALPAPTEEALHGASMELAPWSIEIHGEATARVQIDLGFGPTVGFMAPDGDRTFEVLLHDGRGWCPVPVTVVPGAGALQCRLPAPGTFVLVSRPTPAEA